MNLVLRFGSLSLGASVDQQTGNLSVFDLIEEIRVPQVPVQMQNFVIAMAMEKTVSAAFDGQVVIHHIDPDGEQKNMGSGQLRVPKDQRRVKAVFRFGGFPLIKFGPHRIVVSWLSGAASQSATKEGEAIFDFEVIQVPATGAVASPEGSERITH